MCLDMWLAGVRASGGVEEGWVECGWSVLPHTWVERFLQPQALPTIPKIIPTDSQHLRAPRTGDSLHTTWGEGKPGEKNAAVCG